jgi:integrase
MNARGMGRVFRPKYPPTGQSFKQAREAGTLKESAVWWIAYHRPGKDGGEIRESSHSTKRTDAIALLNARRGEIAQGELINPQADRTTLEDLLAMVKTDRRKNGRETDHLPAYERRLTEFFGRSCRAATITADRIDMYSTKRQGDGAANATINRELATLRRGFRLGYRAGKVCRVPPVGLLRERNVRTGFFEPGEFRAVQSHLPAELSPIAEFAYLTGWRKGEILGLTWAQVDLAAGLVRLEPGSTKNDDGRMFPFSALPALGLLLTRQRDSTRAVERATGQVVRWVFHRHGQPIKYFRRSWEAACIAAGFVRVDLTTTTKRGDQALSRLPPDGGPEPRARRCLASGRHEADRAQDRERLSSVRDRGRDRSAGGGGQARPAPCRGSDRRPASDPLGRGHWQAPSAASRQGLGKSSSSGPRVRCRQGRLRP